MDTKSGTSVWGWLLHRRWWAALGDIRERGSYANSSSAVSVEELWSLDRRLGKFKLSVSAGVDIHEELLGAKLRMLDAIRTSQASTIK